MVYNQYKIKCKKCKYETEVVIGAVGKIILRHVQAWNCNQCKEIYYSKDKYCKICKNDMKLIKESEFKKQKCPKCKGELEWRSQGKWYS